MKNTKKLSSKDIKKIKDSQEYKDMKQRFERLRLTFEEIVADRYIIAELRDFWRTKAGLKNESLN